MLYVQRTTAHFPLPPQCVVVGKKKSGHGTLVYAFNPMTGQPADSKNKDGITFPYDIVQVSLLPLTGNKFLWYFMSSQNFDSAFLVLKNIDYWFAFQPCGSRGLCEILPQSEIALSEIALPCLSLF